jgi:hypothetical protein
VGYSTSRAEHEEKPTYTEELFTKVPTDSTLAVSEITSVSTIGKTRNPSSLVTRVEKLDSSPNYAVG